MTDKELLREIKEDFKDVTKSVNGLGKKITGQGQQLITIENTLVDHNKRITETREDQLKCGARISSNAPLAFEKKTNGAIFKKLFGSYAHWLIIALLAIGFYWGSGGDEEKTLQVLRNLREIGIKVEKIEKTKTEPIRVPVAVSSECVSEEIAP